ncbi:MAG: transglycosylase SLT domain-containing protein [Sulfurifustis sp.]
MKRKILFSCLYFLTNTAVSAAADAPDIEAQRQSYNAALTAARAHDEARYLQNLKRLDGYVLRGYAEYEYLKDRVDRSSGSALHKFVAENAHTPLAEMLRQKWLHVAADRGDWTTFMREYAEIPGDTELTCQQLRRRLHERDEAAVVMQRIEQLWVGGRRLPAACEPLFDTWRKAGHMTTEKIWERFRLAMEARDLSLAREVAEFLPVKERVWAERWQAMHRDPVGELDDLNYPLDTPVARMIVKHGVVRLANRDPEAAMQRWEQLKAKYQFFGEDDDYILRNVGILAAQNRSPLALKWLAAVSARSDEAALRIWRVHAALLAGEWETARRFIAALPEEDRRSPRWRYWDARLLELKGDKSQARDLYVKLARERDYYGFLAADRVGAEYSMQHVAVEATPEDVAALLGRPAIKAAGELYTLGQIPEARRQWQWAIRNLTNRELQVAAVVARQWGWYDRAIYTVALSGHPDDLDLRFPVVYRGVIEASAAEYSIDPGWIYGVVRQESAFVVDARSGAGAVGLMQLMPATGRAGLRRLKLGNRLDDALLTVEHNVRLGVGYLKEVLERYNGHQALATAAYNAGPNRVSSWIPEQSRDADVWIETIPFNETRGYVKNVLAFAAVYEHRLGKHPTRLAERMPPVGPRGP